MKYTNANIKKSYRFELIMTTIGAVLFFGGMLLLIFGVCLAGKRKDEAISLPEILETKGNHAARPAYLDIVEAPIKITESKYEDYYLVTDGENYYISGMTEKDYERILADYEAQGQVHLTGVTKVIIEKQARAEIADYMSDVLGKRVSAETLDEAVGDVHIRAAELTAKSMRREIYALNLAFGITFLIVGSCLLGGSGSTLAKYRKITCIGEVTPQMLDREANAPDAKWLSYAQIYLTGHYMAGFGEGITALRYHEIARVYGKSSKEDSKEIYQVIAVGVDGKEYVLSKVHEIWLSDGEEIDVMMHRIYRECMAKNPQILCGRSGDKLEFSYPFYVQVYSDGFDEGAGDDPQELSGAAAYTKIDENLKEEIVRDFRNSRLYRYFDQGEDVYELEMDFREDGYILIRAVAAEGKGAMLREKLDKFLIGQLADGWGEGFGGESYDSEDGETYSVHFWKPDR